MLHALSDYDDNARKLSILGVVPIGDCRERVSTILSQSAGMEEFYEGNIVRIVYTWGRQKVILHERGIDRVDDFGTAWGIVEFEACK